MSKSKLFMCGYNGHQQCQKAPSDTEPNIRVCKPLEICPFQSDKELMISCQIKWSSISFLSDQGNVSITGYQTLSDGISMKCVRLFKGLSGYIVKSSGDEQYTLSTESGEVKLLTLRNNFTSKEIIYEEGEHGTVAITENGDVHDVTVADEDDNMVSVSMVMIQMPVKVSAVSCGKEHSLFLTQQGTVFSCGLGSRGQLGHGDTEAIGQPRVIEALEGVRMMHIASGGWHSAVVSEFGDLYTWGWNESGQLGIPTATQGFDHTCKTKESCIPVLFQPLPRLIELPGDRNVLQVSCGSRHTGVVTDDHCLFTCGWNEYGQLCLDDFLSRDGLQLVEHFMSRKMSVIKIWCGWWTTVVQSKILPT